MIKISSNAILIVRKSTATGAMFYQQSGGRQRGMLVTILFSHFYLVPIPAHGMLLSTVRVPYVFLPHLVTIGTQGG